MDVVTIGVLGGTFDPIHQGHLALAESAQQTLALSKLLFVLAGDPPHKQDQPITLSEHRLHMLELALADQPKFEISLVDLNRPGPHYTVDTIILLRQAYDLSDQACFFIIGADSLLDLPTWYQPAHLLAQCRLAVAHRPGYQPDISVLARQFPMLPQRVTWLPMPQMPISATVLRQRIRVKQDIRGLVPRAVAEYIQEKCLYYDECKGWFSL